MIKTGQPITPSDFIFQLTAGEALSARDAVYLNTSDGKVYKCDADDLTKIGFIGFAQEAASLNASVNVIYDGHMPGFSGLTINATYYLSATNGEITATKPTNFKIVGVAISASIIRISKEPTKRVRVYTANARKGSGSTQFDITNPAGTTFRYTWDGTGVDPSISAITVPTGSVVHIKAQGFSSGNNGTFIVTGSGANYFEVTNASGVAEINKTIGTGWFTVGDLWIKPGGLKRIKVRVQSAGGGGGGADAGSSDESASASGGGGGYSEKTIEAIDLAATEPLGVGPGGTGGSASGNGDPGGDSRFGAHLQATGGESGENISAGGTPGTGGVGSGGDLNIEGEDGGAGITSVADGHFAGPNGGCAHLGGGGTGGNADISAQPGNNYGGGGGGAFSASGGAVGGGVGAPGVIIIEEEY